MEKIIEMKKYGIVLTGREFGIDVMKTLSGEISSKDEIVLDFKGVASVGSSFADEVVVPVANLKSGKVKIKNRSAPVKSCLVDVARDNSIDLILE
jgi:hypothetical protein